MLPQLDEKRIAEHGLAVVLDTDLRKLHAQGRVSDAVLLIEAAFARHRSADTARIAELEREVARLREAANTLRTEAVLHFNNSVGCATNHYGEDFETHGLPGWIKDSANRIEAATTALGGQS